MSKHDLAKGGYTVVGIAEGASSGINVKVGKIYINKIIEIQ